MRKTLVQTLCAAFCAILFALSGMGGGSMSLIMRRNIMAATGKVDYGGRTTIIVRVPDGGGEFGFGSVSAPAGTEIDWGDGTVTEKSNRSHVYSTGGDYIVSVGSEATYVKIYQGINPGYVTAAPNAIGWNISNFSQAFRGCTNISSIGFDARHDRIITSINESFMSCGSLIELKVPDYLGTSQTDFYYMFAGCSNLKRLELPSGFGAYATRTSGCFGISRYYLSNLKEAIFRGDSNGFKISIDGFSACDLEVSSIVSILTSLQVVSAETVNIGSSNKAKLTPEQIAIAESKGWTVV